MCPYYMYILYDIALQGQIVFLHELLCNKTLTYSQGFTDTKITFLI